MAGQRVPQVGEIWVFAHFKRDDQRWRSRVRIDMVTEDDVLFTYQRHGGEQTATTFRAFILNYEFVEASAANDAAEAPLEWEAGRAPASGDVAVPSKPPAHVVAGVTTSQVNPQTSLVAHPPAPLEQVAPATLLAVRGAP